MYKDKDKQREANKQAMRRNRAKGASVIPCDTRVKMIPEDTPIVILCEGESLKQPSPLETVDSFASDGAVIPKRGKDIKCFADLPPDVQQTIDKMSDSNEEKKKRTAAAIKYQHLFPNSYEPGACDGDFTRLLAQAGPGHVRVSKPGDEDYNGVCMPEAWHG